MYTQAGAIGNGKIVLTVRISPFDESNTRFGIVIFNYNASSGFSFYKSYIHPTLNGSGSHHLCFFNNNFYLNIQGTNEVYSSTNGENFTKVSAITENCLNLDCNSSQLFIRTPYGIQYSSNGSTFSLLSNSSVSNLICSDVVAVQVTENNQRVWKQFQNGSLTNILYSYDGYYNDFRQYGNYQLIFNTNSYYLIIKNKNSGEQIQKNKIYGQFAMNPVINKKIFLNYIDRGVAMLDLNFMQI